MLKQSDVIVTRDRIHGSYECAALVNGTRVSKVYYFYTKREAVQRFVRETNAEHISLDDTPVMDSALLMQSESEYQPKTGAKCGCRRGVERDNCPNCEGTGMVIDFRAIHARRNNAER